MRPRLRDKPTQPTLTVRAAIDAYLSERRADGQDVGRARTQLEAHVLPRWGQRHLGELDAGELRAWRDELASLPARVRRRRGDPSIRYALGQSGADGARRRRSTVNRIMTVFKAALNHAAELHPAEAGNAAAWRAGLRAFRRVDARRDRWLERDEIGKLLHACAPDFRALVQAALYTGCRYGELRTARVSDFQAPTGILHVPSSKSGQRRDVILHEEATAFFSVLTCERSGDDPLLTRVGRDLAHAPWGPGQQARRIAQACQRAGLVPPISFHGLRHTYASLAIRSGMVLLVLARNLGHADTRMVEKHYGHLADEYVREQVRRHAPRLGPLAGG